MSAKCMMVLGATSGAGKSWLCTALCRWYSRKGLRVAPFKAQNMSNNARVVAGGEIGSAQYFQALAAGVEPDVRMNPLLLKPEADARSQVVLLGQVDEQLSRTPWRERSRAVWPRITSALDELRSEFDLVVIEGAGSPAEINLKESDVVNMRVAEHADARCLLVVDIDRGGAFAHLYGTWALLEPQERERIQGFVLNRFRGDQALLAPGPQQLERLTGVRTLATLPMWATHGLPEEDGWYERAAGRAANAAAKTIAIVAYPRISNLDEFQPLAELDGVSLSWVRSSEQLDGADWVILPGSKSTSTDFAWLRARGLDAAIREYARAGGRVLGICGGLQMLGNSMVDPYGVDGACDGLNLLPLVTRFEAKKTVRHTDVHFGQVTGPWSKLNGARISGFEIHHGITWEEPGNSAVQSVLPNGLGWQNSSGNVLAVYVHGMFESAEVLQALFGMSPTPLATVFEGMANFVDSHFAAGSLEKLLERA